MIGMIRKVEGYFLDRHYPKTNRRSDRARLMVRFALITIMFAITFFLITFLTGYVLARYVMAGCIMLFSLELLSLRLGVPLQWASQFFIFSCWMMVNVLTLCSGGLQSITISWNALIPVTGLMLIGRRGMRLWGLIVGASILFFFFTQGELEIPAHMQAPPSDVRSVTLNLGLVAMILTLVYVFHRQGRDMLTTIQTRNAELNSARVVIERQRDEIAARNENLEGEVNRRTQELVDYNRQLEQFAFIASHNLRAPVATLLGLGQLMDVKQLTESDREQISRSMITTARELDRVVRDLSTILEMRKSSHELVSTVVLEQQLSLIRVSLERELSESGGVIEADFKVATVQAVRPLMDSILMNLVSNAIKYRHPDRRPRIRLRSERVDDGVCLSVSDNGLGMDLKTYGDKVFSLYGRFHSHVDGKGLGLYLVKTHVQAMGGRVEVESKPEKGSTFRVFLKE